MNTLNNSESNDFVNIAKEYCTLIDERDKFNTLDFLKEVLNSILLLYHSALKLPDIEYEENDKKKVKREITQKEWTKLFNSLQQKIGKFEYYREIFDPTEINNEESVIGSLADDLADIYRDLKNSLNALEKENLKLESIWDFRFNFYHHYGQHIVDAIRAIHYIIINSEK